MAELDLLQLALQYGPGLAIAVLVLVWKRADDKRHADTLEQLTTQVASAMKETAVALSELCEAVDTRRMMEELEGRLWERLRGEKKA